MKGLCGQVALKAFKHIHSLMVQLLLPSTVPLFKYFSKVFHLVKEIASQLLKAPPFWNSWICCVLAYIAAAVWVWFWFLLP